MMNPASIMKLMNAKNKFTENHPKVVSFLENVFSRGVPEGTIIEMTVTTNMKVKQSDLDLLSEINELAR